VNRENSNAEMLKGTLDMMILRTLIPGDAHGHTIASSWSAKRTDGVR